MKKIMFNDRYGLTKAVLEGRKTMTRRIVPECRELDILLRWEHNKGAIATGYEENTHSFRFDYCPDKKRRTSIDHLNLIPSFKPGEVVAVAQSYEDAGYYPIGRKDEPGWRNKMFVRADLMPHQIRITNVRVERLQDINDQECVREGITTMTEGRYEVGNGYGWDTTISALERDTFFTPREAFAGLIDEVSGKGTWASNPWVFVYEFELLK